MAGNIPAICLEGYTPVPSGLHLGIDPTAEVPTRVLEAPALPGIVQVHLGDGALGATRIGDALAREHVATIARMVQTLAPDVTRSVTRAGVDAWTGLGLPVRLPGRTDLLDPADQYVLPVDAAGRVTDPRLATGVVVLPKHHLAETLTTAVRTDAGPAYPAMSGQLRFDGDAAWIGLPAAMVNGRHADVTEVRPTGETSRVTSFPALLTHLETLRPGERAVVDVTGAAGAPPQTYQVIASGDGLSVLGFSGGTATAEPLPRTFDAMTVTMPGQLGGSAATLASGAGSGTSSASGYTRTFPATDTSSEYGGIATTGSVAAQQATRPARHLAAPVTTLEPLVGEPNTTPLANANGVVFGVPGSKLVQDLSGVRLPESGFVVLGEGYRNDAGNTVRGGIRSSSTAYATAGTIGAQIPPGTAKADIIACEIVSTGTLRELFRQRPGMTVVGADTEVFVVQGPEGSAASTKVFAAETVWVDGRPQLVQTAANQFRAYRPGMSPDAEPEALGHYLPGTGVPTKEDMARAVEASGAFEQVTLGGALHLGPSPAPVAQIARDLTNTRLEDPKPGLQRAQQLTETTAFEQYMRMLLEKQIAIGEHLEHSLKNLGKEGFVRASVGAHLHLEMHRAELHHAISDLHGALASIPGPRTGATVNPALDRTATERRAADIAEAIEGYARTAEEIAKHMSKLVTDAAVKAAVRGEDSKPKKVLEKTVGLIEGALGWTASATVSTGLPAVPAVVSFVAKGAGVFALQKFEEYQAKEFQQKNSSTKALLLADINPALMAKSIAASYQRGFELFMALAGVAGAYIPGWPVISAGLIKIVAGFFEERVKVLEKQIADMKAAEQGKVILEKQIYRRVGDRLWADLRAELKAKLENIGTIQQGVNVAKGEPELLGLVAMGTDFGVRLGLGLVFTLLPPKPATKIDGEDLRQIIMDVIGNRNPVDKKPVLPTSTPLVPEEAIPASVPQTDEHGRAVIAYKGSKSTETAPYVKINVHGTNLWGALAGRRFTPEEPDAGAFVPREIWRDRVIGSDYYLEMVRDPQTGQIGQGERVEGTWHQPWPNKLHFLFVHSADGMWEWGHAISPTGRLDSDEFSLAMEFDRHPQWLKPFTFEAPTALAVNFGERTTEPTLNSWALRQFADNVAWKAADLSRTHGPSVPLKIHVEGGSNGRNALSAEIHKLKGKAKQTDTGLARAEAVRTRLVTMLDAALTRFRYLHPGQADRLPNAEELVASASTRGSQLDASKLPDGLLKEHTGLDAEVLNRQTRVWLEELTVTAPGSPASAQGSLGSSFHESDLDIKPNWLVDAQEKMPHPQNAPANLVSDTGALVAKGAPPRDLLKLAEGNPGQTYYWLSTPARQAPTSKQITELNEALEQFAQGGIQVSIFTKGVVSSELLDVIAPYGGALANSAPAVTAGLSVSLDNPWHLQPADRTVPRSQRPDQPSPKLDEKLAETIAKLHRDPGIPRADEAFGAFVWGGLSVREQYAHLQSESATYLTQANKKLAEGMAQRVKTSVRAGIVNPLLTFGAETDVVPRYHDATMQDRPKVVISSVYELAGAGVKADVPITEKFQTLVEATARGATDDTARDQFDFTSALLKAVDLARAGKFDDTRAWVDENKSRLDATMKPTWVDALGDVVNDLKADGKAGEAQQLEKVLGAVYDC